MTASRTVPGDALPWVADYDTDVLNSLVDWARDVLTGRDKATSANPETVDTIRSVCLEELHTRALAEHIRRAEDVTP